MALKCYLSGFAGFYSGISRVCVHAPDSFGVKLQQNVHELATCRTYIEMYMNLHDFMCISPVYKVF